MKQVTLFTRRDCHLCELALHTLNRIRTDMAFALEIVDVDEPENEPWLDAYDRDVPVVHVDGREVARHRLEEARLRAALEGGETPPDGNALPGREGGEKGAPGVGPAR